MSQGCLNSLEHDEQERIRQRATSLSGRLEEWAQRYDVLRTSRIPMAALTTATVLPHASLADATTAAQMILWIFGMDDQFDERLIPLKEIPSTIDCWCAIAGGDPAAARDLLGEILVELQGRLAQSDAFELFREYWISHLRRLGETMAQEYEYGLAYRARGSESLPALDEYVRSGMYSIGLPFWMSAALILLRDPAVPAHFELVDQAIMHAGVAIRLYNDLRTFEKEVCEGGVNSIMIVCCDLRSRYPDVPEAKALSEARQHVLTLADTDAQHCYELVAQLGAGSQFQETLRRLVALHAHFYARTMHDYHTTSQAEAYAVLSRTRL
jgi:hypothetical protein